MKNRWQEILKNIELLNANYENAKNVIGEGIALFGAGQAGMAAYRFLKKHNYKIDCFIDNSPLKQGTELEGIPVVALDNPMINSAKIIFITAKHAVLSVKKQLAQNFNNMSFDAWFVIENIKEYEYIRNNVLCDNRSKECLDGILLAMLTGNEKYSAEIMDYNQYFCIPQFVNVGWDYFVDAGAYVGDTVEKFIWANNGGFKQIYAFEPGGQQLTALKNRKERLVKEWALETESISVINAGLSDKNGYAKTKEGTYLCCTGLDFNVEVNSQSAIKVYALDSFIKNSPVTFIKADIEGMEVQMLKGAKQVIMQNKPKMAISTYHEPDDLFEIVKLINKLVPEYKMALRHHSPILVDTTLYCWIEG